MVVGTATAHHHGHHDHYHSNAATAVQYCSRVTELVRYLKNNFEADTGGRRRAEKILARTSQMLVPEYDDDLWKRHFERRQKHMQHGFFTPQHIPYHSLGDIALDTGQLVFDVFKDHLPEKHKLPGISLGVSSRAQENAESPSPDVTFQKFQGPSEGSKTNVKNAAVASAGFLHIKHQLQDSEDIMTAVKGGQTFDKCVKELEQTRKSLEESIHSQLSSLSTMPPVPRGKIYSRYGYPCKPVAPVKSALSMRLIMTPSPAIMNNDDDEMDMMKMSFYRSRKMLLRKLEAIHTLLCCMHNVKSRDLRSRVPLSHDTVKTYSKKDVILDHNGRPAISRPHRLANAGHAIHLDAIHSMEALSPHGHHGAGGHHSTHHHHHHHYHYHHHHTHPHTHLHPHSHPHPSVHGAGTSKHHQDAHHSGGTDRTLSMLRAVTPTQTWRKYRSNLGNRMHKEHRHDRDHRVDTWDDLLHAGHTERHGHEKDKDKLNPLTSVQHRLSSQPTPHNQRFHGVFSHIVSSYRSYRRHDHHHEKPPYWLLEGVTVPDKVKKTAHGSASQGDKPAEEDDNDIESPVEGLRTEFDKVQSKMTRDVLTDLERMERERCKTFIQKFMALKLSPLFEKELRAMRSATAQHANGQEMDFDVKPSKWYIDLKTDCHHVVGNHDCDINDILKKLYKFSFEDAKSIPSGKERLCLIVMSLPADELMTIHMQMALYFVLENILNAPPEFFSNWLAHRKIPIVILHT